MRLAGPSSSAHEPGSESRSGRRRSGAGVGWTVRGWAAAALCAGAVPLTAAEPAPADLIARFPEEAPRARLVMSVVAKTGDTLDVGEGPDGARRIVPIIGGTFTGEGGLRGAVLPGGADRQRLRPDGIRELDATYELRTDDGVILMVHNQVLVDAREGGTPGRYVRSVVRVVAPAGRYEWLNRRLLIGTLASLRPSQPYVLLRFYEVQ